jgi:hypothetical protein
MNLKQTKQYKFQAQQLNGKSKLPQSIPVVGCPEKITNETSIF